MGFLTENTVNISSPKNHKAKSQDPIKPKIQIKLEKWEKSTPTSTSLHNKLNDAQLRRDQAISYLLHRASNYCNEVSDAVSEFNDQKNAEIVALEAKIAEKNAKAIQNKAVRTNFMVKTLAQKNKEKEDRIKQKRQFDQLALEQLEAKIKQKINNAVERKNQILSESFMKAATVEEDEESIRELKAMNASKLEAVSQRRLENLNDASQNTKEKQERIILLKQAREADILSRKAKLENKLSAAQERKEEVIQRKRSFSAELNMDKATRAKEVMRQREVREKEVLCKMENKLTAVLQRKMKCDEKKKESLKRRHDKVQQANQETRNNTHELKELFATKMDAISKRRMKAIDASTNAQKKQERIMSLKKERQADLISKKEMLANKLIAANESRDVFVSRRRSSFSSDNDANASAEVLALQVKIAEKNAKAVLNKERRINNMVASLSQKNKEKEEKVMQKRLSDEIAVEQIESKMNDKINGAVERKNQLLSESIMKAEKVDGNTETLRAMREMTAAKLEAAAQRRMKVLDAPKSAKGKDERIASLKKAREVNLVTKKMELANKLEMANARKEELLNRRRAFSSDLNVDKAERAKEVIRQREAREKDVQSKIESRLTAVFQRKEEAQSFETKKRGTMKTRREKVFQSYTTKMNVTIPKTKENISNKLTEASIRRETLLAQRAEQAGFSRANKTTISVKSAKAPEPFHAKIHMLPLALWGFVVNFFKNIFHQP